MTEKGTSSHSGLSQPSDSASVASTAEGQAPIPAPSQQPEFIPQQAPHQGHGHQNYQPNKPHGKHYNAGYQGGNGNNANASRHGTNSHNGKSNYHNKRLNNNYSQKGANHVNPYSYGIPPSVYPGGAYYYQYPSYPGAMQGYYPQLPLLMQAASMQHYPGMPGMPISVPGGADSGADSEDPLKSSAGASASNSAASTPAFVPSQLAVPEKPISASASPVAPAAVVSPATGSAAVPVSSPTPPTASAVPAAAPASSTMSSAAEEFRRKIRERAAKAKQAAEEKAAAEKAKLAAAAAAATAATADKVEIPVPSKPEPVEKKTEAPAETKADLEQKTPEPVKEVAPAAASTPVPEVPVETKEEIKEPETVAVEELSSVPAQSSDVAPEADAEVAPAVKAEEDVQTESQAEAETTSEAATGEVSEPIDENEDEDDLEEDEDEEDDEDVFDLSAYFSRVASAKEIEDPFAFTYPAPLVGVDQKCKEGKKKYRYDPNFLLQFKDVVLFPIDKEWKENLEGLGIVPNRRAPGPQRMNSARFAGSPSGRMNGGAGRQGQYDGRQNSRTGSRRRGGSSTGGPRDSSLRNRGQSRRGQNKDSQEPPKPAEDVKPLVASANRWVPRSRLKKEEVKTAPDGTVLLEKDEVERKVNSSLNKLTLEMFEPITEDLLTIAKQSRWEEDAQTIKQVISLTFAKACDEPYWSAVYAQFCAKMLKEIPEDLKDVNTLTKSGEPATGGDLARRILLATCQSEYEKGWIDNLPTNEDGTPLEPEMMSDEYYIMAAAKRRGLGLVKFIGNLYILNMLNDQVILHCLRDQSQNLTDPSEERLESLAQLITTVGPRFEASDRNKAALKMIFDNIQQILDNCPLPSRIKFMLMDLQDLKASNWRSLKPESGPKTIKEIHNEAELKKLTESKAHAEKRRQNKPSYGSGGFGGGDSRSNSTRGGSSWGNKKDSRVPPIKDSKGFTSVSRSQSNRPTPDTSMSSSHMSPRENSKRTDSMASNIFAALDGDNDEEAEASGP